MESSYKQDSRSDNGIKSTVRDNMFHIPTNYGDNKIVLMIRDPWTIYAYWEIRKEIEDNVKRSIDEKGFVIEKSILRVYDVTDGEEHLENRTSFEFELKNWAESWYVHTGMPGRKWMVDIGILCTNGEFFCLARSNVVITPAYGMSGIFDEEWMCPEDMYYKMFAVAGGYGIGTSSLEMKEILERHLKSWFFSGGISSGMFGSASLFSHKR